MPGPNSTPWANTSSGGAKVEGKTALRRAGLHSGQNAYGSPKAKADAVKKPRGDGRGARR